MDVEFELHPLLEDDIEVLEILEGIPRRIYNRNNYFESMDDLTFFKRFRLTRETVLSVLGEIDENLEYPYDKNNSVSPFNQLLIALRFYATGSHLLSVADFGGTHVSTTCRIVKRVSTALAGLCRQYIKMPQSDLEKKQVQQQFFDISSFPRMLGAIDGTHIKIQSPGGNDVEVFRNRKTYFSINVQAISDAKMRILDLVARWPGSAHDATIFNNSRIKARFEANEFKDGLLLGDSAYNIRSYLLTPLLNPQGIGEQRYNESHIRTRGVIEKLFGIWKRRFPIMAYGSRLKLDNTLIAIVATAVLHNIARNFNEEEPPQDVDELVLNQLNLNGNILPVEHEHGGG